LLLILKFELYQTLGHNLEHKAVTNISKDFFEEIIRNILIIIIEYD